MTDHQKKLIVLGADGGTPLSMSTIGMAHCALAAAQMEAASHHFSPSYTGDEPDDELARQAGLAESDGN